MFNFKLLLAIFLFFMVAESTGKVVKWHSVSFNQPSWRTSQRSRQIQGYGPMSAFAESGSSRPLFFGSWRKRFDEE
ncbi:hypothetical protein GCK72_024894 [Caenorhabditis remanei]|uniref:Uncharacterized protein n=3 Tax=Caenorhabditis TaxID=6237 RepID=E3MVH6_CAERE|nr:hypothetical protein GCK72_024894 [Caenorhabditis remanei]EFP10262.1 hypothetical protein CRE_24048 [Caenorhabditis remanei]KAF1748427.1 hypothetical protein GCK72_024894 [Caenorhabditis remanei]